jgi:hypothetical protein
MRTQSPHHDENNYLALPPNHSDPSRGASEASYVTAIDDQERWLSDGSNGHHELSAYNHGESHLEDDQETVMHSDRLSSVYDHDRPVSGSSWDGGRAV